MRSMISLAVCVPMCHDALKLQNRNTPDLICYSFNKYMYGIGLSFTRRTYSLNTAACAYVSVHRLIEWVELKATTLKPST